MMLTASEVESALGCFSDPATAVEIESGSGHVRIRLTREGIGRDYFCDVNSGVIEARHNSHRFASLDSLLASVEFADLRSLASTQQRTLKRVLAVPFLKPAILIDGAESDFDTLKSALNVRDSSRIVVTLLDGPAGVGKTRLIEQLTLERAQQYQTGGTLPPVLHVTSRGRRLSNVRDVLAAETQILRARFTFEQVPLLVRRGLILLAIDGFDELVDADGYRDAWFALRDLLEEVGNSGVCLLAGRDTFFDQQGFLDRLESIAGRIQLTQAHLGPVSTLEAREYLVRCGWPREEIDAPVTDDILAEGSYTLRPYFLSVLGPVRTWDAVTQLSPRAFLVERFIDREAALLHGMVPIDKTRAAAALLDLFQEAAKDMAEREADTVDVEYLGFLCEVAFSGVLDAENLRKLQHKIGSVGLMEIDAIPRLRRFPHSEIQHFFLAKAVCAEIIAGSIPLVLRRGVFGLDFLEVFQDVFELLPAPNAEALVRTLQGALDREISGDRLHPNGAALLLSTLSRHLPSDPRTLRQMTANEATLVSATPHGVLENVIVARLDVRGADLRDLRFTDCEIPILVADEFTQFGDSVPLVHLVYTTQNGSTVAIRPPRVSEWLTGRMPSRAAGVQRPRVDGYQEADLPLLRYFDRVCRRAIRQTYLRIGGDDPGAQLLTDPLWPEVEEILKSFGRVEVVVRSLGGNAGSLVHIKGPRRLLQPPGDDAQSSAVREQVMKRGRKIASD